MPGVRAASAAPGPPRVGGALVAAQAWPAHLVVFDALHPDGTGLTAWPHARRRAALETLSADAGLTAPFTLCPSTAAAVTPALTLAAAAVTQL